MTTPSDPTIPQASDTAAPTDADRREALAKLGKLAALTAPTVLTLLLSPRSSAFSPPIDPVTSFRVRAPRVGGRPVR